MMQEMADKTLTWQSQWHVKASMASMKHSPTVGSEKEEQGVRQLKAEACGESAKKEQKGRKSREWKKLS